MGYLRLENEKESRVRNQILTTQQKQYTICVKKIDMLIDMRASGEITEEEFKTKKSALEREKIRLHESLGDTDTRVTKWLDIAGKAMIFAQNAKERFEKGSPDEKRLILASLGSNLIVKDKVLTIEMENRSFY